MKKAIITVIGIWVLFVGGMLYSAAYAQDAAPKPAVPMIQGTIHLMDRAGNVEPIIADRMFSTVDECYSVGQAALVVFIPQMPNVVGYMIVCEPAGTDV